LDWLLARLARCIGGSVDSFRLAYAPRIHICANPITTPSNPPITTSFHSSDFAIGLDRPRDRDRLRAHREGPGQEGGCGCGRSIDRYRDRDFDKSEGDVNFEKAQKSTVYEALQGSKINAQQ